MLHKEEVLTELLLGLHAQATTMTDAELYDYALDAAVALTDSVIGFFHTVSDDQTTIALTTWNRGALENCTAVYDSHYPLERAGNWADCVRLRRAVIYNDFPPSSQQRALPEGHAAVRRFMSIPVVEGDKVRMIFGVGNKPTDYDERDTIRLQLVANELQKILLHRRADEALVASEHYIRGIIENVDQGFIVVDRDYRILTANRAYCGAAAVPVDQVIGRHCHEISHHSAVPCPEIGENCPVQKVFETGQPVTLTHRHTDANGQISYVEVKAFPFQYESGVVISAIETVSNITARYLLDEERMKTDKVEAIGTLAGGIAHDFNNLLQGVFGFVSLARRRLPEEDRAHALLGQAEKALEQATRLTNQLLTFAKGGRPIKTFVMLPSLIEDTAHLSLSGSRCECRLAVAGDLWSVEADGGQIAQVIQNIVGNASDAMPDGGTVTVSAENVTDPIPDLPAGRYVRIAVSDSGGGICPEHLGKIFDPYFTTKETGSGLGLATSYSIVRNHGGAIDVRSAPGRGSTFTIYLPAADAVPATKAEPAIVFEVARKRRVLVMDDEALVRDVAAEMLAALGHEVETAGDGAEALARYRAAAERGERFDVVILDLTVRGGAGGQETNRRLLEFDPGARTIVSSGYSDGAGLATFRDRGFRGRLNKPYRLEELQDVLAAVLAAPVS